MHNQKVCVIGLGYIGLPTAALLASSGYYVSGVDINKQAVETINKGEIHIVEPDLDAFVRSAVSAGRLQAYDTPQPADIFMISVPTPIKLESDNPEPSLECVFAAAKSIAPFITSGNLIILESTSPVGSTEQMAAVLKTAGVDVSKIHIAYCPERVLPGKIMSELVENDRVVGGLTAEATKAVSAFYKTFVKGEVLVTNAKTAEMCKLTENSFRDVNIAFANELSMLCDKEGIDTQELIGLASRHPRVNILQPGVGVGGHCIAVDPWFIVSRDPENAQLIKNSRIVNLRKTEWVLEKITHEAERKAKELVRKPKLACLGLAFKPDIDDLRESPAVAITQKLIQKGYGVVAIEPNIEKHVSIPLLTLDDALKEADLFIVLVGHREFNNDNVKRMLKEVKAIDFCGLL